MLQRITEMAGVLPDVMTMDAGYWSENNVHACADQGRQHQDPHGPQAQEQEAIQELRLAQSACGTGERSDHGLPAFEAIPDAGIGEGERRVAPVRRHPQPALAAGFSAGVVIGIPPITAAGAGGNSGMRSSGPDNAPRAEGAPPIRPPKQKNRAAVVQVIHDSLSAGSLCPIGNRLLMCDLSQPSTHGNHTPTEIGGDIGQFREQVLIAHHSRMMPSRLPDP